MQSTIHPISGEELMAYLDGELPGDRAVIVHQHLETCRECQSLAADLQAVSRQLNDWHIEEISTSIKVPEENRKGKEPRVSKWVWIPIAAAALLAGVAVFYRSAPLKMAQYQPAAKAQQTLTIEANVASDLVQPAPPPQTPAPVSNGPMIIRTAELKLTARNFDTVHHGIQETVKQYSGYIAEMSITANTGEARSLHASLRVPAAQLDSFTTDLRKLGQVTYESQRGEDVTKQFVDLNARLNNARNTEQRLTELLRDRTGKLSDVLAVEEQIDNVRGQIERMEADVKSMSGQIAFSAFDLTIAEEYKAPLSEIGNTPIGTRLRNAAVDGYHNLIRAAVGLLSFLLSVGPVLLVIAALLFFPLRLIWRKTRSTN